MANSKAGRGFAKGLGSLDGISYLLKSYLSAAHATERNTSGFSGISSFLEFISFCF